jgi:hypothetical protein
MSWRALHDPSPAYWKHPQPPYPAILNVALILTTAITLLSGLDYVWKNRAALRTRSGSGVA